MRILIHDYSGHPFQVQLSRALAKRNHEVLHLYCSSFQTPRGIVNKLATDCNNFSSRAIELSRPFEKYKFSKRIFQEIPSPQAEELATNMEMLVLSAFGLS